MIMLRASLEGIWNDLAPWRLARFGQYFDDVVAIVHVRAAKPAHPSVCSFCDQALLRLIHRFVRSTERETATGLYLDEDECVSRSTDKIDFAATACSIIATQDFISVFTQKTRG